MRKEGRRQMQTRFSCLLFSLSISAWEDTRLRFYFLGSFGLDGDLFFVIPFTCLSVGLRPDWWIWFSFHSNEVHQRLTGPLSKALGRTRSGGANLGDCLDFSGSCHLNNSSILESSQSNRGQPTRPFLLSWDEWEVGELILKMIDCCCLVSLFR